MTPGLNLLLATLATLGVQSLPGDYFGPGYRRADAVLKDDTEGPTDVIVTRTVGPVEYTGAEGMRGDMWVVATVINNKSTTHGICVLTKSTPRITADGDKLKWINRINSVGSVARYIGPNSWLRSYKGWATRGSLSRQAGPGRSMRASDGVAMAAWRAMSPQDCSRIPADIQTWISTDDNRTLFAQ